MSENVHNSWEWTPQREKAALAVATSKSNTEAAKAAGVSDKSIQRWMDVPEFAERVDQHIEVIVGDARRILRRNAAKAAQTMVDAVLFGNNRLTLRVTAAKDVLDRVGLKAIDKVEHTGKDGGPIAIDDARERLGSLLTRFAPADDESADTGGDQ